MRLVTVSELAPGMVLARPVWGERGLLVGRGVEVSPGLKERLEGAGVESVCVVDPLLADLPPWPEPDGLVCLRLARAFRHLAAWFWGDRPVRRPRTVRGWTVFWLDLEAAAACLAGELPFFPPGAVGCRGLADPAGHALEVALLAGVLAREVPRRCDLVLAGLLHDLALLEGDEALGHPLEAVRYLYGSPLGFHALAAVAQHHERWDGGGYPRGLNGSRLFFPGQLLAVAEAYASARVSGVPPLRAWRSVREGSGSAFDPRAVQVFCRVVAPYSLGSALRLESGEEAVVVGFSSDALDRPVVRVVAGPDGRRLESAVTLDLARDCRDIDEEGGAGCGAGGAPGRVPEVRSPPEGGGEGGP